VALTQVAAARCRVLENKVRHAVTPEAQPGAREFGHFSALYTAGQGTLNNLTFLPWLSAKTWTKSRSSEGRR